MLRKAWEATSLTRLGVCFYPFYDTVDKFHRRPDSDARREIPLQTKMADRTLSIRKLNHRIRQQHRSIASSLLAIMLCAASPTFASDLSGRVSRVHDGDTFTLAGQKVRIWGIDAPELKQQCGGSACGNIARDALQDLVRSRTVVCTQVDRDRYKRVVASCRAAGRDIGEQMVRSGNALDYRRYSRGRYRDAERSAQARRVGMWSGEFDRPWDYRRR